MNWLEEVNTIIRMTANRLALPFDELNTEEVRVQAAHLHGCARTELRAVGHSSDALKLASEALSKSLIQYLPKPPQRSKYRGRPALHIV